MQNRSGFSDYQAKIAQLRRRLEGDMPNELNVNAAVAHLQQQPATDTDVVDVGVMAARYLTAQDARWADMEVMRVLQKLRATEVTLFADKFGMYLAPRLPVPYRLAGSPGVPCHPEFGWHGPIDIPQIEQTMTINGAIEVYELPPRSKESLMMVRQYVLDRPTLVLVGGKRAPFDYPHPDTIHINHMTQTTVRKEFK